MPTPNTLPPTPYYGWRIAWVLALTTTISYGILYYAFSVIVRPMEAEMGWSRAQTSLGYSLFILLGGAIAIPFGRWVDQHGARGLMTLGSLAGAGLVYAWAHVQSLPAFYLILALSGLAGAALFYEVAFTVVAAWFRTHRARATWLITLVAGLASTIFIPLTTFLVERLGWRGALEVLALLQLLGTAPLHFFVLRRKPSDLGLEPDGFTPISESKLEPKVGFRDALKLPKFWWLSAAFALQSMIAVSLAAHLVPLLGELKHSAALVAGAAGMIGATQVLGRVVFAPISSRFSLFHSALGVFGLRVIALIILLAWGSSFAGIGLFVLVYGITNGAMTLVRVGLISELFGSANFGSISGAIYTAMTLAQALAPFGVGAMHTLHNDYFSVMWVWIVVALFSLVLLWQVGLTKTASSLGY